jgi:hypothetical protein
VSALEYLIIALGQEAALIAQIIWYFIEGFRSNEYPFGSRDYQNI